MGDTAAHIAKPSHVNKFFDRLRGKKHEKHREKEFFDDANKENGGYRHTITSPKVNFESTVRAKESSFSGSSSPEGQTKTVLQRLRNRLSFRKSNRDHVQDSSEGKKKVRIADESNIGKNYIPSNTRAASEGDLRFVIENSKNSSTLHDDAPSTMSLNECASTALRNEPPPRTPSYMRISLGMYGYLNRPARPAMPLTLSNVERMKHLYETTTPTKQLLQLAKDEMGVGRSLPCPVKGMVACLEQTLCSHNKHDDDDVVEVKKNHNHVQIVVVEPKSIEKIFDETSVEAEWEDVNNADKDIVITTTTEGANERVTQEAASRQEQAVKVNSGIHEKIVEEDVKPTLTIIQVQPKMVDKKIGVVEKNYEEIYAKKKAELDDSRSKIEAELKTLELNSEAEEAAGLLRVYACHVSLLQAKKLKQFGDLLDRYITPIEGDEQPVLVQDLDGWWDMLVLEFGKLEDELSVINSWRENGWSKPQETTPIEHANKADNAKKPISTPTSALSAEKQKAAAERRKKMLAEAKARMKQTDSTDNLIA